MATDPVQRVTIQSLIDNGTILAHKDGNYGSSYPRTSEFGEEGVPFLTAKVISDAGRIDFAEAPRLAEDKADQFTYGFIESGDVLLSHNATIGRVAVVPSLEERTLIGTSLTYFRVDQTRLLPRYLAAYLSGHDFQNQLKAVMSHSTRNQVPITAQRKLSIVVPPIEEQTSIAHSAGVLDDKIEQNRRTARALERLARAIFRAWFVDFEPVKAKAAGATALPSMPQPVFDALPTRFVDSDIGPVPEGWEVKGFGEVLVLAYGKALKADGRQPGSIPVYGSNGQVGWHNEAITAGPGIVVGRKGNPGTVEWSHGPFFPIDTTFFVKLTDTRTSLPLLFYQLQAADLGRLATDSAVPGVNRNMIYAERCFVPRETVRAAFDSLALELWELQATLMRESAKLAEMCDFLLPKLLSGAVRVKDAERIMENTQ